MSYLCDVACIGLLVVFIPFLCSFSSVYINISVILLSGWPAWWAFGFSGGPLPCLCYYLCFIVFRLYVRWQI